jgi:hypothetical protein
MFLAIVPSPTSRNTHNSTLQAQHMMIAKAGISHPGVCFQSVSLSRDRKKKRRKLACLRHWIRQKNPKPASERENNK